MGAVEGEVSQQGKKTMKFRKGNHKEHSMEEER